MFDHFLIYAEQLIATHGFFGLFLASFFEEMIAPILASGVVTFAGFFFLGGEVFSAMTLKTLLLMVSLPAALGLTLGTAFGFFVSYAAGKPMIDQYGKRFHVTWESIERLQSFLDRHKLDEIILILLRAIPLAPSGVVTIFCGITRWNPVEYFLLSFVGFFVRATIFGLVGWQLGTLYHSYAEEFFALGRPFVWVLLIAAILSFGGLRYRAYRRKKTAALVTE